MAMKLPAQADSVLNMTPMIDIVFQLILFFLLNLRFKSLDYRIETQLPRDRGIQATNQIVEDIPSIKVSLFRQNEDDPTRASTKIKIDGRYEKIFGPYVWSTSGDRKHDQAVEDLRDQQFKEITAIIATQFRANSKLKGEIEAPPPKGASVPHGDIMRVLGCFLEAGVAEVNFGGAPAPLPKAKGGHGP